MDEFEVTDLTKKLHLRGTNKSAIYEQMRRTNVGTKDKKLD
jgi:hypothetical protein